MAVILAVMTPTSVLAEEDISWTSVSEEALAEGTVEDYAEEEIAGVEETYVEEAVDTPEVSYEEPAEVEEQQEEVVLIDDAVSSDDE